MADENDIVLDLDGPQDLGKDSEGRRIICVHRLAEPIRLVGKRNGKLDPDRPLAVADELQFREPTGSDIAMYGLPAKLVFGEDGGYTVEFSEEKMSRMMGGLLVSDADPAIRMALVRKVSSNDWVAIAYELAHFFTPARPTL